MPTTDVTQAVVLPGCAGVVLCEAARWGISDVLVVIRGDSGAELLDARLPRRVRLAMLPVAAGEGTGGALRRARDRLAPRIMLLYGVSFPDDLGPALTGFAGDGNRVFGRISLRDAAPDAGNVRLLGNRVAALEPGGAHADGGVCLLYREAVDTARDADDMVADVLPGLARRGLLRATAAPRWAWGEPRPALLVSWDKVLRIRAGNRPDEWARGAQVAIGHANRAGWHVFAVTAHDIGRALPALREAGMTIDDFGPDPAAMLRAWGARAEESVMIGGPGMAAPEGVAARGFMGGDVGALVASVLRRG